MPFPDQSAGVGMRRPLRKLTLDIDGVEAPVPSAALFERRTMRNGEARLLIAAPPDGAGLCRALARHLPEPLFLLYILHTPRGQATPGRYQSPALDSRQVDDFLATFAAYLAGDGRHDLWVYSPEDGRTLIWDRHDLFFVEGEPLEYIVAALGEMGFVSGIAPRLAAGPHVHHYREEFDAEAAAVLDRFDWFRSDLRPEDEQ
jgi:hypothetical protein